MSDAQKNDLDYLNNLNDLDNPHKLTLEMVSKLKNGVVVPVNLILEYPENMGTAALLMVQSEKTSDAIIDHLIRTGDLSLIHMASELDSMDGNDGEEDD